MHITKALHHLSVIDPAAVEREREAILDHQRKVRAIERLDVCADAVAAAHRRVEAEPTSKARKALARALHRHRFYTAAAVRDGLISGKDTMQ